MSYGLKDWKVEFKGVEIGTLGEMQDFDDLIDFGLVGNYNAEIAPDKSLEIACELKGVSFKRLLKIFGIKRPWLDYSHEWSTRCRSIRSKLRKAWRK